MFKPLDQASVERLQHFDPKIKTAEKSVVFAETDWTQKLDFYFILDIEVLVRSATIPMIQSKKSKKSIKTKSFTIQGIQQSY